MNKRKLWGALAALAALYATRMALKMASDMRRYNHILSLSNEGRMQDELPELLLQLARREQQTLKEWAAFVRSAPKDAIRYLKIGSM